jgi:hypothetical protein
MVLENAQLRSLHDSIDGMTVDGVRTLGCLLDMGIPSLPDAKFVKSLKDEIQIEIQARCRRFDDPRWGR